MTDVAETSGPPEPLSADHDSSAFDSGEPALDDWLRKRALANEQSGASRTYVITAERRIVGFYCLSAGSVAKQAATGHIRRNMPEPISVMIIGRLAIDRGFQGRGLGKALLRDAVLRTLQAATIAGMRAILLHAISENAKLFYVHCGFSESPLDPMMMMLSIAEADRILSGN
jgi:GNAT superfamily N-acetyltransferase